jgi:AcrR family transcriptional regulator
VKIKVNKKVKAAFDMSVKKKRPISLDGRLKPTQERAKDSVELILSTAARLLDEVGVERFNTNLLAERANIRVRTVYRYFPNKYAVIVALTKALAVEWDRWESQFYTRMADPSADWRQALSDNHVRWMKIARGVPGALSVLQAMDSTPELKYLHVDIFESQVQKLVAALRTRGLKLPPVHLLSVARTVINSMNTGMDLSLRLKGNEYRQITLELAASQAAYLEKYLDDPAPSK